MPGDSSGSFMAAMFNWASSCRGMAMRCSEKHGKGQTADHTP
jgi:hypothetical protein